VHGRRVRTRGVTLVEAAIVISLVGILLAVFLPTFVRNLRASKIGEAPAHLQTLVEGFARYYPENECVPAAAATPDAPSDEPNPVVFQHPETPGFETWAALGFEPDRPVRYRYEVIPHIEGCGVRVPPGQVLITFRAVGDLDADGHHSTFERELTLDETTGRVVDRGLLYVRDRVE
jgi:hypothetical protein